MHRLVIMTVNTGLWTAVVGLIELSLVAAFRTGTQFWIAEFPIGSLYVNTLLANLNARQYIRNAATGAVMDSYEMSLPRPGGITSNHGALHKLSGSGGSTGSAVPDVRPLILFRCSLPRLANTHVQGAMAIRVKTSTIVQGYDDDLSVRVTSYVSL